MLRLVLVAFLFSCCVAQDSGFAFVVSSLSKFQNGDGGFRTTLDPTEPSSIEATSHALFLSSLYGLKNQIDVTQATKYVQERENSDGGYGRHVGLASDIESVRHALMSFQHLGASIPSTTKTASFILDLYDTEARLFRNRADEKPDLKSSAVALEALNFAGELQRWSEKNAAATKSYLEKHIVEDKTTGTTHFAFPEESSLSPISANYYAIVIATLVNYEFKSVNNWAKFIISQQSPKNGGIFADSRAEATTVEASAHAAVSLRSLGTNEPSFADHAALLKYLQTTPRDLSSVALAHLAVASTKSFADNLKTALSYETADHSVVVTDEFVQGSKVRPILTVTTFNDVPHAGLEVDAEVVFPNGQKQNMKMVWSEEKHHYAGDAILDTKEQLGEIKFDYTLRCVVSALGGMISFEVKDVKRVGYAVLIEAAATQAGKQIEVGGQVGVNTDFAFRVKFGNATHDDLRSGNFKVFFKVVDSSNVEIHTTTFNANENSKGDSISFSYTLADGKLPSGVLSFVIDVADNKGVHTHHVTPYSLSLTMIATDIQVNHENYKIGDKVRISMIPATLDQRTVSTYPAAGAASGRRNFYLDISSSGGVLLESVKGVAEATANGASKYVFETKIGAYLQMIGSNVVSFRFGPHTGKDIQLSNFDIQQLVIMEDPVRFSVDADLRVVNLANDAVSSNLHYGSDITFDFAVVDQLSKSAILSSPSSELANIYIVLQHKDANRPNPVTTARLPCSAAVNAQGKQTGFAIQWSVNANAVPGDGILSLVAQDADGKALRLWKDKSDNAASFPIHIGGEIQVTEISKFSSSHPSQQSAIFLVEFGLSCETKSLTGALLKASVMKQVSGTWTVVNKLGNLLVASNDGSYQVSWTIPFAEAASGDYKVAFYRETEEQGSEGVTPFIEIVVPYVSTASSFPVKLDLLALVGLTATVFFVTNYKTKLTSIKKSDKKQH